jgi:hypothetical protein
MGFMGGFGRLLQGKPIFEVPPESNVKKDALVEQSQANTQSGPKVIPTVYIERSEYHNNGSHMQVMATIRNHSAQEIELNTITILGVSRNLNLLLRPGENRECTIYEGERPHNHTYDNAYLRYKDQTGDYFETHHTVEFRQELDGTYHVYQMRYAGPVKDI